VTTLCGFFIAASGFAAESGSTRPTKRSPSAASYAANRSARQNESPANRYAITVRSSRSIRSFTRASSSGAMCIPPRRPSGSDGCESTGARTAGSSMSESAKFPVKHMPIAPTPRPPHSRWACAASARSQSVTGLDWSAAKARNSRLMQARTMLPTM
jgi:hypothetical protein